MSNSIQKILLVDDELDFSKTLKRHLKREGFTVETACDCSEARCKIESSHNGDLPFDLLITEVGRQEPSCIGLVQWLKKTHPEISLLLLTSLYGAHLSRKMIRPEMDDHASKPLTPGEMMSLICTINRKRKSSAKKKAAAHEGHCVVSKI